MKALCPHCQQHIDADDNWAGLTVVCPTCQKEFALPNSTAKPPKLTPLPVIDNPVAPTIRLTNTQSKNSSFLRTFQVAIVCITVLLGLWIWRSTSSRTVTVTAADGSKIQVNLGAIEDVLKQDATSTPGASSVADVVNRMKAIDTSNCPGDFRAAYLAHIHAWETMAEVEQQALAFKSDRQGDGDFVEGFIRGFLGDPFGKANEISAAQSQIQRNYQEAHQEVKQTFNRVQEIAVGYGARLPAR